MVVVRVRAIGLCSWSLLVCFVFGSIRVMRFLFLPMFLFVLPARGMVLILALNA